MAAGRQFLLLLWKNWLLQRRKVLLTVLEILLPTLLAAVLILIRQRVEATNFPDGNSWNEFNVDALPTNLIPSPLAKILVQGSSQKAMNVNIPVLPQFQLGYTPRTPLTSQIINKTKAKLGMDMSVDLGFADEGKMEEFFKSDNISGLALAGIAFQNMDSASTIPKDVIYKIRMRAVQLNSGSSFSSSSFIASTEWYTEFQFPRFQRPEPRERNRATGGRPGYYREGFLALQNAIDQAIIKEIDNTARVEDIGVRLRRYPYPPYIQDTFIVVLQRQLPFIILLSFIIVAPSITKDIVLEKERKLKETMKMMGLHNWLHWTAWFIKYFMFLLISVFIMTILFVIQPGTGGIIRYSDGSVILVFLLLYSIATISFCFAVSTFFSKANTGAAAGGILFLATYLPYFFLQNNYETLSFGAKFGPSLLHNVAMAFGCVQISLYEGSGEGLQWHNLARPISVDDNFTMAHVFLLFLLDTAIYLLITWYVDAVYPGAFGIPKPFYFPFTKWYWCGKTAITMTNADDFVDESAGFGQEKEFFEPHPPGVSVGISIRKLRKVFKREGQKKVAVAGMSIDMYEGQITALLGHNGAGKTTTMSMLTGFLPPTDGTAYINGHDINTDIEQVRSSLGLCPQHDVLFDTLTVKEHLVFFAKLKGVESSAVDQEVDSMISLLNLEPKRNVQSKALSGGMKRKLSVGIALMGGSKTVILDEPTSGMDPEARRQVWDILQSQRQGRTMILSTHFMDEADFLGDRIAIMAEGVVKTCGSSLFLKGKYGVGYHMVIVKHPSCDVGKITATINSFVPAAELEANVGAELSYVLPQESSGRFEELFSFLEQNKTNLGISSYGASVTTLEEVFLKVGESVDEDLQAKLTQQEKSATNGQVNEAFQHESMHTDATVIHVGEKNPTDEPAPENRDTEHKMPIQLTRQKSVFGTDSPRNKGMSLYLQQFRAMFFKRVLHSWRNRLVTLTQILVPFFFTLIGCVVLSTFPTADDNAPALTLDISPFKEQVVTYVTSSKSSSQLDGVLATNFSEYIRSISSGIELENLDTMAGYTNQTDLQKRIKDIGQSSLESYNRRYLFGAVFDSTPGTGIMGNFTTKATAGFNNQGYHTPAISLGHIANTLLRHFTSDSSRSIQTVNHPLPKSPSEKVDDGLTSTGALGFILSYNVMFGTAFLIATFAVFLIKERVVKAKHVQFVSGVHAFNFWISTFTWDVINYLIPTFLLLIVFAAFNVEAYTSGNNLGYVFLVFLLYGWAIIPFTYLLSLAFSVPATGYVWLSVLNIFLGTASVLAVAILKIPDLGTRDVAIALEWVFYLILPNYSFGQALTNIYSNFETTRICKNPDLNLDFICPSIAGTNITVACCKDNCGDNCAEWNEDYFAWETPGIGRSVLFMTLQGVVFFVALFVIESGFLTSIWQRALAGPAMKSTPNYSVEPEMAMSIVSARLVHEDDDVAQERRRIEDTPLQELLKVDVLVLSELKKFYGNFLAVDRLSVGVPRGECFGLLGVNGAGKTTTFKMMTGDETISSGNAFLDGFDVKRDIKEVQQRVGYCPQFDALIDQMTVRETLRMYGRLRGIPEQDLEAVSDNLISSLLLDSHADKQAADLSGGNKRKLSTAIALIGDPPIVFLDEPTTGMDPVARRLLWDTLSRVRASGTTLVLTSHSMEECEALCTRVAIMVNGQFKCLGSTQHLKTKFGEGYTMMAKLHIPADTQDPMEQLQPFMDFINTTFPGSVLKDMHHGLVNYQLQSTGVTWASVFGTMERARDRFGIEDYSVSQTTLEQVFLNFARAQVPPSEETLSCGTKCSHCCDFFCCCGCLNDNPNQ